MRSFERPDLAKIESIIQSSGATDEERTGLSRYREMVDPATGDVMVEYTLSGGYGRLTGWAKRGNKKTHVTGTSMRRVFRNLVFGETYDDLDIVNAAGHIMCQLFRKHGLNSDELAYYNEHREDVLCMVLDHNPLRVERETAKQAIIEVLNCGSGLTHMRKELGSIEIVLPPFMQKLKTEMTHNISSISAMPEFSALIAHVKKKSIEDKGKTAWDGQFAAAVYQDEERKCLEVIVHEVETIAQERKIERATGSLIYDGLTIKKELEIGKYIARLEKCIGKKTDYALKLQLKEMGVSAEERAAYIGDRVADLTYEAKKARFEATRFKTLRGKLKFHTIDAESGKLVSESREAFATTFMDWMPVGGNDFVTKWFNDGLKRMYNHIEYSCVKKEDQRSTVYYAFPELRHVGLVSDSTEAERQANVEYFLDYLLLLVEDNPAYVEWLVMWLADILVNPHDKGKQPIAVVLWGEPGAGKTSLRGLMTRLLGENLVHHTQDPLKNGDVLHDFNSSLQYKLFIEFEEINFKTHSQVADGIKALITNHTHSITEKGYDSVDVRAVERALFTTNNPGSVVIETGDRRYVAFAVSVRRVRDSAYWDAHYQKLHDHSYIKDVAEYLLSRKDDVARYAMKDQRPITGYYRSLQHLSCAPELDFLRDTFLYEAFGQEFIASFRSARVPGRYAIPSSLLCGEYNRWRAENSLRDQVSSKCFTMKMVSHGTQYGIGRDTSGNKHNAFLIDSDPMRAALGRDFGVVAPARFGGPN